MAVRDILKASLDAEGVGHLAPFAEALWGQEGGLREDRNVVGAPTKSGERARSPFQLMPSTARALGFTGSDEQLQDPAVAAPIMAKLLKQDFGRFGGNLGDMAAAYYSGNAKKDASGRYLGGPPPGVPGPSTNDYAQQVLARMGQGAPQMAAAPFVPADKDALITENFAERQKIVDALKPTPEFASMFDEIQTLLGQQQSPQPMQVPERVSPVMRAIAGFAGGMNAVQTGSGQLAQNIASTIAQADSAASQVESLNYARRQAFDENKFNRLLDLKMKALEIRREAAEKAGDIELAQKLAEQELKLSERLKKEARDEEEATKTAAEKRKLADDITKIEKETEGRLKVVDRKASVDAITNDYGVPREIAQQMHDHRTAITQAYTTQLQALGGIASLPDAKARQLRQELIDDLLASDKRQLELFRNSPAGRQAAVAATPPPAAAPAAVPAPADTAAVAPADTSVAAPADTAAAAPRGRGRLGL